MASLEQAREAKAALKHALAEHDGVTGIGLTRGPATPGVAAGPAGAGDGEAAVQAEPAQDAEPAEDTWCLQVNVVNADARGEVPQEVDGVAVVVRVTGHVGAG
ncbi:hypothetical protein ACFWGN_00930 [Oerskovia sp. NPDC060338]|uniref:hypothetical protein n=1 Tax=Oerskovia sp. NPDC060338 TaxID=3347100 RepID=UPI00365DD902